MKKDYGISVLNRVVEYLEDKLVFDIHDESVEKDRKEKLEQSLSNLEEYIKKEEKEKKLLFEIPEVLEGVYFQYYTVIAKVGYIEEFKDKTKRIEDKIFWHTTFLINAIERGNDLGHIADSYEKYGKTKELYSGYKELENIIRKYYVLAPDKDKDIIKYCIDEYMFFKRSPLYKAHIVGWGIGEIEDLDYENLRDIKYITEEDLVNIINIVTEADLSLFDLGVEHVIKFVMQKVIEGRLSNYKAGKPIKRGNYLEKVAEEFKDIKNKVWDYELAVELKKKLKQDLEIEVRKDLATELKNDLAIELKQDLAVDLKKELT